MADKESKGVLHPVPTLSKKLIQKTLGNKKKVIRNTLLNPHPEYWPILSESENNGVLNELQRLTKVPQEKKKKKLKPKSNFWRESTELGINAVSRRVKKHDIASVLLAEDVNPKSMMQHVITMCTAEGVPVLVVQGLRIQLENILGFPTTIIGLKNCVADKSHAFHQLHTLIVEFAKLHKPPAHLLQFKKPAIDTIKLEVTSPKLVESLKEESTCNPIAFSTLYLNKTSTSKAFIPPSRGKLNKVKSEFISLGKDECEEESNNVNSERLGVSQNVLNPKKKLKEDPPRRKSGFPPLPPPLETKLKETQKPHSMVDSNSIPRNGRTDNTEVKLETEDISCSGGTLDHPSEELGFISFGKDESEEECYYDSSKPIGISHTILNPKKKPRKVMEGWKQNYYPPHIPFKYARVQPKPKKKN